MPEMKGSCVPDSHLQLRSPLAFGHLDARFAAELGSSKISEKPLNEAECEVENLGAVQQTPNAAVSSDMLPPVSAGNDKCRRKTKASKCRGFLPQNSETTEGSSAAPNIGRYDSSLCLLTKKFLNLLRKAEDGTLDLNKAAEILDVQKRRLYDITNVLEGVGLIEKKLRNMIHWKGTETLGPTDLSAEIFVLKAELETLYSEEGEVDEMIRETQENLRAMSEDGRHCKWLFVTQEDISSLPCFEDATLVAVKAPHGTSVEVPDPDEGVDFPQRHYQVLLRSSLGPISCYLISKHEGSPKDSDPARSPATISMSSEDSCEYYRFKMPWQHSRNRDMAAMTFRRGRYQSSCKFSSGSFSSQDMLPGVVQIVPSDPDMHADYLLLSEAAVSITDSWTESAQ